MLIAAVVGHDVHQHPQAVGGGVGDEPVEVLEVAVGRVDGEVVGDVVPVVALGRRVDRVEPDRVGAEGGDVVEAAAHALEVADAVAVGVGERPDVDLVHDGVLPPVAHEVEEATKRWPRPPARPRRRRRGPGGARRSRRPGRPTSRRRAARGTARRPASPARPARPSRACASSSTPVWCCSRVSVVPSKPIGTRSVLWTMPLAVARIHHCSMSSVMPRSWPTTIPGVTISTARPRSASSSATDVAWWKPISSITTIDPAGAAAPVSTSRTSHDVGDVGADPPRALRLGAGGDDDVVGTAGARSRRSSPRRRTRSSRRAAGTR